MIQGERIVGNGEGLRVAVVGCGYWGVNYLRVLRDLAEVHSVVAVDSRPNRLKEIQGRFPDVSFLESFDEAIGDPSVDAFVICTPASTHYDLVRRCIMVGKPVLVEKPIATSSVEAQDLIQLADRQQLTLAVGHTFLHNAAVHKVKSYLDSGELGELYYLYTRRTNLGPIRDDVNALWDLATHDVSIVNYLLGRTPAWVSAVGINVLRSGVDDVGFIVLGYEDKILAHVHVSWADPNKVREVVVVGSQRRIVFDDLRIGEQVRVYEKGVTSLHQPDVEAFGLDLLIRDGDIVSPKIDSSEPLKNQCVDFIESIRTGRQPSSAGLAGLAVVEVMEAIDRSVAMYGAPVGVAGAAAPGDQSMVEHLRLGAQA